MTKQSKREKDIGKDRHGSMEGKAILVAQGRYVRGLHVSRNGHADRIEERGRSPKTLF